MAAVGYLRAGAPFIRAKVRSPIFAIDHTVAFLIDTGASHTALLDFDAKELGLAGRDLPGARRTLTGVGGPAEAIEVPDASLVLPWDEGERELRVPLCVIRHRATDPALYAKLLSIPSLLGRDVLAGFRFVFEPAAGIVRLEGK